MAEEVDAERQAFMDELGMTYVELEKAAADQEEAPPAQDIGSASDASDGSPTPATSWGFFAAIAEWDQTQDAFPSLLGRQKCCAKACLHFLRDQHPEWIGPLPRPRGSRPRGWQARLRRPVAMQPSSPRVRSRPSRGWRRR